MKEMKTGFGMHKNNGKSGGRYSGKNRERWKTGGILAALIAAAVVFAVMLQTEKNLLTRYEKGIIYTAGKPIPKGLLITEDNREIYFREQELDRSCIPETALTSPEQAEGLMAAYDIDSGTLLTSGMFEEVNLILAEMEEPVIAGFKAEDIFQVAGGILRAGDRIHIYSVREEETVLIWPEVFVQQVFDAAGNGIGNEDRITAAQRVNVYLDKEEVNRFYAELSGGSLRAVKVCSQ